MNATAPATGLFISFEGIDGAGKSTHIEALAEAFERAGRRVTRTREPGGTPLAETLRGLVLTQGMDPLTEALLVFAARREHVVGVLLPALARGDVVLCDRFADASFAYQGSGRDFSWEVLSTLEGWVQARPEPSEKPSAPGQAREGLAASPSVLQPHLTLWFDLSPHAAAARLAQARAPDRFEAQPQAFFEKVRAGYAQRAARDPQRFARIDALPEPPVVWQAVLDVVRSRGWL